MALPVMDYPELETRIEQIVGHLSRTHKRVYPWQVGIHLDFRRVDRQLRRDMRRMARDGKLIRISARGGYVPVDRRPGRFIA